MVSIGEKVPNFTAAATGDKQVELAELLGDAHLVLYFYPKDNTPGCTREGQDFAAHHDAFAAANCTVLGVSRDSLKAHENFRAKFDFPFDLLSDPDETLCRSFDVIKEKNMYGRKVMGVERSTFLIDSDGVLRAEWRKVKVPGHVEAVLEAVRSL